jgi:hypothetical protein
MLEGVEYDWSMEYAPAVVETLAGGSVAQRGVIAGMLDKVAGDWGSMVGLEGTGPPSLLSSMSWLIFVDWRESE